MHSDRPPPSPDSDPDQATSVATGAGDPASGLAPSAWPAPPQPGGFSEPTPATPTHPQAPSPGESPTPRSSSPAGTDGEGLDAPRPEAGPEPLLFLAGHAEQRWIQAERSAGGLLWGLIALGSLGGLVFTFLREERSWAWQATLVVLLLLGLLGVWLWRRPVRLQAHLSYRLDAEALTIQKGVLWRRWTSVPRARVQYVDLVSGPIDQRYKLSKLVIHTAGSSHGEVELPGLSMESALALRAELVRGLERESL